MLNVHVDLPSLRRERQISTYQLAKKLGITRPTLNAWENDPERISLGKLRRWADAMGLELEVRLTGKEGSKR